MIKLNDSQLVILSKAINNSDIVPNTVRLESKAPSALSRNINTLIKKGFLELGVGLNGTARIEDFAVTDEAGQNRRLFVTDAAYDMLEGNDSEDHVDGEDDFETETPVLEEVEQDEVEQEFDDVEALEDEELALPNSVVRETYKQIYADRKALGGSGQGCADGVDQWMTAMFMTRLGGKGRPSLHVEALLHFATENGIEWSKWAHVNNGMKRMNIAKKVRTLIAAGQDIVYGHKVVFKGQGTQPDAKAA
jgi:hypothetical protein